MLDAGLKAGLFFIIVVGRCPMSGHFCCACYQHSAPNGAMAYADLRNLQDFLNLNNTNEKSQSRRDSTRIAPNEIRGK